MALICDGRGAANGDHCCYVNGVTCAFLVDNTTPGPGRYRCGLRLEHDDWDGVVRDPRYRPVGETWVRVNQPFNYCQTFDPALCCQRRVA